MLYRPWATASEDEPYLDHVFRFKWQPECRGPMLQTKKDLLKTMGFSLYFIWLG